ncbi:MAG: hypothetical protein J6Y89_04950 [Lachnospiraceae bacterium]|nr:hypothetical protein [Lachnospiraceae bacterium]
MIKVENIEAWGFEHAIRGIRNPYNSHDKSDSVVCLGSDFRHCKVGTRACPRKKDDFTGDIYCIGPNDLDLMRRLYKAGVEHRTYARMIQVSMDITAPLLWWREADRYSVGKTQISTSTMHSIHKKEFKMEDFSNEHILDFLGFHDKARFRTCFIETIKNLNIARQLYLGTGDKQYWNAMIYMLPSSYNQLRTVEMSYEVVFKIIRERTGHKLDEWNDFVEILKKLPYVREIMEDGEK